MLNSQEKSILNHKDTNKTDERTRQQYLSSASHKILTHGVHHQYTKLDISHNSNQKSSLSTCKKSVQCCGANRHAPSTNSTNSGVGYAELQIILENVQAIKANAMDDIKKLQQINEKHENTIKQLQYKVSRYENIEATIQEEKQLIASQFRLQLTTKQEKIQSLQKATEQFEKNTAFLKIKIADQDQILENNNRQIQQLNNLNNSLENRCSYITDRLGLQGDKQIDFVYEKYGSISNILSHITKLETRIEEQEKHYTFVANSLEEAKDQIKHSNKIIEQNNNELSKISEQHRVVRQQLEFKQKEAATLINQVKQLEQEIQTINIQKESKRANFEVKLSEQQLKYEEQMGTLLRKNDELQLILEKLSNSINLNDQEQKFKQIVDGICDENEDYENIIKRLSYLQKFRSQYYLMVNRVQYLSRMLDE